jgi:hypothetical protein
MSGVWFLVRSRLRQLDRSITLLVLLTRLLIDPQTCKAKGSKICAHHAKDIYFLLFYGERVEREGRERERARERERRTDGQANNISSYHYICGALICVSTLLVIAEKHGPSQPPLQTLQQSTLKLGPQELHHARSGATFAATGTPKHRRMLKGCGGCGTP